METLHRMWWWTGRDRLLLKTWLLLGAVRLGLWLLPFRHVLHLATVLGKPKLSAPAAIPAVIWAVECSTQYMPGGAKCLARAIATQIILQRQGYCPNLRIGVAKSSQGKLEAHAWIEYQGRILIGDLPDLARFLPLPSLESIRL